MKVNWQSPAHARCAEKPDRIAADIWAATGRTRTRWRGTQTERRAIGRGRRRVRRLVIDRQIGQPHQPLGVVLRAVGRLHQVAREIIVERRQAAGVGMTPGIALHRSETLRRQLRRHPVHADFGINDHVRRVGEDRLPPGVERQRAADETLAQRCGRFSLGVAFVRDVIAEQPKPAAVELAEPALDRDFPVRMLPEEAADDRQLEQARRAQAAPAASPAHNAPP